MPTLANNVFGKFFALASLLFLKKKMESFVPQNAPNTRKPQLLKKIEGFIGFVNEILVLKNENGVITASDDRFWLYRSSKINFAV